MIALKIHPPPRPVPPFGDVGIARNQSGERK